EPILYNISCRTTIMNFPFQLSPSRAYDVAGFGTNAVDFLIRVPEYPAFNSKVELIDYVQAPGGEIATAMVGLQRLGLRTRYAGRFGDDAAGAFGLDSLKLEGIDTGFVEVIPGAQTQIAFIVIDERSGERTVIWKRDARLGYSLEEAPLPIVENACVLHITPHDVEACIALACRAKEVGTVVSIDLDNTFPGLEDLLPLVDVMITSAEWPSQMFGIKDKRDALTALRDKYGAPVVGITLGEHGSLIFCEDMFIETPGFVVPGGCKDTTGAGDAFRTGLLFGMVRGESIEESARMANAVAALKCRAIGARTSLPNLSELESVL
ncbi:MAG: carbohydrate kinase family protein, partial [bacterium]|nr:carbohydrate kinase family protein [bacterium]